MKVGGFLGILLTVVASGALLASPADAAKSKKSPSKAVPVTVASASASSSGPNELVTATATCPKGKIVVGGGFSAPPVIEAGSPTDINLVYKSLRVSARSWRVSAVRDDSLGAGPAVALTSLAYCRTPNLGSKAVKKAGASKKKKKKQLSITKVSAVSPPTPLSSIATATATCPGKLKPLSGGFSSSPPPDLGGAPSFPRFFSDFRSRSNAWTASALHSGSTLGTLTVTSVAYCASPASTQVTGSAVAPAAVPGAIAVVQATSQACPKGRSLVGGGFSHSPPSAGGPIAYPTDSRAVEGSWVAGAMNLGPYSAADLGSRGYCL